MLLYSSGVSACFCIVLVHLYVLYSSQNWGLFRCRFLPSRNSVWDGGHMRSLFFMVQFLPPNKHTASSLSRPGVWRCPRRKFSSVVTIVWKKRHTEGTEGRTERCWPFWGRNYFFLILSHPVYKMWIIQEPNILELWNKPAYKKGKNGECIPCLKYSVPIFVE
jgi:hypothetical protein